MCLWTWHLCHLLLQLTRRLITLHDRYLLWPVTFLAYSSLVEVRRHTITLSHEPKFVPFCGWPVLRYVVILANFQLQLRADDYLSNPICVVYRDLWRRTNNCTSPISLQITSLLRSDQLAGPPDLHCNTLTFLSSVLACIGTHFRYTQLAVPTAKGWFSLRFPLTQIFTADP